MLDFNEIIYDVDKLKLIHKQFDDIGVRLYKNPDRTDVSKIIALDLCNSINNLSIFEWHIFPTLLILYQYKEIHPNDYSAVYKNLNTMANDNTLCFIKKTTDILKHFSMLKNIHELNSLIEEAFDAYIKILLFTEKCALSCGYNIDIKELLKKFL